MTVAENIALIPEMKGLNKEETLTRTRELLTKVGLEPDSYLERLPKDLSGEKTADWDFACHHCQSESLAHGRAFLSSRSNQ